MIPSTNEFYYMVEEMSAARGLGGLEDSIFRQLLLRGIALLAMKLEELAAVIAAEE